MTSADQSLCSPTRTPAPAAVTRGVRGWRTPVSDVVADQAVLYGPVSSAGHWLCPTCLTASDEPGQCPLDLAVFIELGADGLEVLP